MVSTQDSQTLLIPNQHRRQLLPWQLWGSKALELDPRPHGRVGWCRRNSLLQQTHLPPYKRSRRV